MGGDKSINPSTMGHLLRRTGVLTERNASDSHAQRLSKTPKEHKHRHGKSHIFIRARGLDLKLLAREENPQPNARDQIYENPLRDASVHFEEDQEARTEGGERPAGPDGPAVSRELGDHEASQHRHWGDSECGGKQRHAGDDGRIPFYGLKV